MVNINVMKETMEGHINESYLKQSFREKKKCNGRTDGNVVTH